MGCDGDGDLILYYDSDCPDEEYTVDSLKDVLDLDEVSGGTTVLVKIDDGEDEDGDPIWTYYDILDDRFEINWKRKRVDIFIE